MGTARPDRHTSKMEPTASETYSRSMAEEPDYGQFPLRDFLEMELSGDEPGYCIATVDITDKHHNPDGVVHGAVFFALVDTAMGKATMSVLDEGMFCATIEM